MHLLVVFLVMNHHQCMVMNHLKLELLWNVFRKFNFWTVFRSLYSTQTFSPLLSQSISNIIVLSYFSYQITLFNINDSSSPINCTYWHRRVFPTSIYAVIQFHFNLCSSWFGTQMRFVLLGTNPYLLHAAESLRSWLIHLAKKFAAFYETRRFITAFTNARHLSVSWASSIQSIPKDFRDRGSTAVKVLSYKSEGHWFDTSWCHWKFSLT